MGLNTYVAVGNKEDVSDLITNIAPHETPLLKLAGRGKAATETYIEWLEDDLPAAGANAKVEGAEFGVTDPTPRGRLGNY
ncbi:MAG TPA: phage head protein, partial [Synergistaceae bacterium]|nr:phage head protein [Synergistaceae bacterium]